MRSIELHIPPFNFQVSTDIANVMDNISTIYGNKLHKGCPSNSIIDYVLSVRNTSGVRKFVGKQARFLCDYNEPFKPLSQSQAYALFEWGMNWTIASHEMQYVIVHAGVLAKDGKAILFPAPPGSGKSTLTAHLAFNGWQLLSDEMALIEPLTNTVIPFVRPICLKNSSIDLAKSWFPNGEFSTIAHDTHKGDVIHLSPPQLSWDLAEQKAKIIGVVFPNFKQKKSLEIYELTQAETFMQLAENAFNFAVVGERGFKTLANIVEAAQCFEIFHSDLNDVQAFLEEDIIANA